jgi:hypothetical protein
LIISSVIGWNQDGNKPNNLPGLFGFPKGFVVSTESQGSGNLHAHILIWIHGLPETYADYLLQTEMDPNPDLLAYPSNLVSPNLPVVYPSECLTVSLCFFI